MQNKIYVSLFMSLALTWTQITMVSNAFWRHIIKIKTTTTKTFCSLKDLHPPNQPLIIKIKATLWFGFGMVIIRNTNNTKGWWGWGWERQLYWWRLEISLLTWKPEWWFRKVFIAWTVTRNLPWNTKAGLLHFAPSCLWRHTEQLNDRLSLVNYQWVRERWDCTCTKWSLVEL